MDTTVAYPFVSKPIVPWTQNAKTSEETDIRTVFTSAVLPLEADPTTFFQDHSVVYLIPGVTYRWNNVPINKSVTVYGQGATVKLNGSGPILFVQSKTEMPEDLNVVLENILFSGGDDAPNRHDPMTDECETHSAVWIHNAWKTTITKCSFENFKGSAVWYSDKSDFWHAMKWNQQHLITECRFDACRIGISNTGACEYSMANGNQFFDCHICFNVIGGQWMRSNNIFCKCRSAYFHVKEFMWYAGTSGNLNAAKGMFTNNFCAHCDHGSLWPSNFRLRNNTEVSLAGIYFDDDAETPPLFHGNFHWFGDVKILNFPQNRVTSVCFTGCHFYGHTVMVEDAGKVEINAALKDKVYLLGCTGDTVTLKNIKEENVAPSFGTIK
ncbi:E1B-2 [Odocoileus adenovirus 1]|uniref:E1B-2 n=1 Tax=Odocoileus adenovirus 1 TaxID=78522 RepID=A0A223PYR3_9ADEN|nr:E1B-2 [Odocoileus adenovirus 1]